MKRILLGLSFALALLGLSSVGASAACTGTTAQITDSASATRQMALVNDPTGTNCAGVTSNAAAQATVSAGNTLNGVTTNTTGTSIPVTGFGAVLVNINCSVTCSGGTTLTLKGADVSGTFGNSLMFKVDGGLAAGAAAGTGGVVSVTNQTGQAYFCAPNFGYTNMRVDASAYSAGTISATITPINANACGYNQSSDPNLYAAATGSQAAGNNTIGNTVNAPTSSSSLALTKVTCGSAVNNCVLKNAAGNFYGAYAECTSACWLMLFNATSAPADGATTAGTGSGNLVDCIDISAGSSKSLTYPVFPVNYSVGITAVISSTACASKTASAVGFVTGTVQ